MELNLTPSDASFKIEVEAFVNEAYPLKVRQNPAPNDIEKWHSLVAGKGWTAVDWPSRFGGTGWSTMEQYIWHLVTAGANCPQAEHCALQLVGPLIQTIGQEHHQHHLSGISSGTRVWGNATFQTSNNDLVASPHGGAYEIKGDASCLTSTYLRSGLPDWIIILAFTESGHSLFLVDRCLTGLEINTSSAGFSNSAVQKIRFSGVKIPADSLMGELNNGLKHLENILERDVSISSILRIQPAVSYLQQIIEKFELQEELEIRLASIKIQLQALEATGLRYTLDKRNADAHLSQIVNIKAAELTDEVSALLGDALGYYSIPAVNASPGDNEPPLLSADLLGLRGKAQQADPLIIDSTRFQRDLVARTVLGL